MKKTKKINSKKLQKFQLVAFDTTDIPEQYISQYPFKHGDIFVLFGEIEGMPGHVIIADKAGKVFWGYHTEDFRPLTEEEL